MRRSARMGVSVSERSDEELAAIGKQWLRVVDLAKEESIATEHDHRRRRLTRVGWTHVGCRSCVSLRRQGELYWVRQIMGSCWFFGADLPDGQRLLLSLVHHDFAKGHLP